MLFLLNLGTEPWSVGVNEGFPPGDVQAHTLKIHTILYILYSVVLKLNILSAKWWQCKDKPSHKKHGSGAPQWTRCTPAGGRGSQVKSIFWRKKIFWCEIALPTPLKQYSAFRLVFPGRLFNMEGGRHQMKEGELWKASLCLFEKPCPIINMYCQLVKIPEYMNIICMWVFYCLHPHATAIFNLLR